MPEKRKRISISVNDTELECLNQGAAMENRTVSDFVKMAALRRARALSQRMKDQAS